MLTRSSTQRVSIIDDVPEPPPLREIRARIQPVTISCITGASLWAKIVGVYSNYTEVRKIKPDGTVLFDGLDDGLYVFMVLDGNRLRSTQTVEARFKVTTVDTKLVEECIKPE